MTSENPYSPPRTESNQPIRELLPRSVWARRFLWLQLLVVVFGITAAFFIHMETIIATGVALGLVGLVLLVVAWRCDDLAFLVCGFSGPAFSVFVFLLIFFNQWSPNASKGPVLGLSSVYLLCLVSVAIWLVFRRSGSSLNNVQ